MIGEKAKVKNFDILQFVEDNAWLSTFEAIEKAYNAGVSEQRDFLDKIRAKIEKYKSTIDNAISEDELKIEGMKEAYADCLKIIDKYKAEIEPQERSDKE